MLKGDTLQLSPGDILDEASDGMSDSMEEIFETCSMLSI
jgi:hypothetical protein